MGLPYEVRLDPYSVEAVSQVIRVDCDGRDLDVVRDPVGFEQMLPTRGAVFWKREGLVDQPLPAVQPTAFDFELVAPVMLKSFLENRAAKISEIL